MFPEITDENIKSKPSFMDFNFKGGIKPRKRSLVNIIKQKIFSFNISSTKD
ncbi:hypothetical protein THER_1260 [Thermodesulfovibrio sp. N1]|nr:hypothetical protein THER_1260 [Thermodesulfovibrio sp. N1]